MGALMGVNVLAQRREIEKWDLVEVALLWFLGVPLPIVILLALFWHH